MGAFDIQSGYLPGAIGRIAELHGRYYHREWGFGVFFEARVAKDLAAFCESFDPMHDQIWLAMLGARVEGSIVIDGGMDDLGEPADAHLRYFIISDRLRGQGVGGEMMDLAIDFCRRKLYPRIYLNTFAGLNAARHLYEKYGFELVDEQFGEQWGTDVLEQRFELQLL
jgi:GNAT superfamily N-acetyltransferase